MSSSRFEYLFNCYLQNNCTDEEKQELMSFLSEPENESIAKKLINRAIETTGTETELPEDKAEAILNNILAKHRKVTVDFKSNVFSLRWFKVAVAASII